MKNTSLIPPLQIHSCIYTDIRCKYKTDSVSSFAIWELQMKTIYLLFRIIVHRSLKYQGVCWLHRIITKRNEIQDGTKMYIDESLEYAVYEK